GGDARRGGAGVTRVARTGRGESPPRRTQVVEEIAKQGKGGFYAAQLAAVETRERKQHVDLGQLREDWRARAAEHGLGARELLALLGRVGYEGPSRETLLQLPRTVLRPPGLAEKQTPVSEPQAVE